ncbi:acyltransferase family protein [Mycolicibacterium houstonense]|uniref:acyltransferase family protein n=1 Tax=Mycolicibacterium houstonense TaxID=146021 RepID=UPI000835C109|nr:acyltransferase family protein [Mycolicibacterium houstonense]
MTAAPVRAAGRRRRASIRRDIPALDGIRAIAVALVLAGHGGVPGVAGGFIGVDIFFVLSGFLITSLLLDEYRRTEHIDLKGFWIRRAKRLLPAMVLMALAVVIARDLFPPEAVATLREDAVAAFFWMANWVFVAADTDYFSQGATPSPLQHTWSLAVEEQYYVLWPLLVLGAILLLRRRRPAAVRAAVFVIAVLGVTASAVCGIARGGPYRSAGETLNQKPECDSWPERWAQRIAHDRPETVLLMIGRWEAVDRTWRGRWTHIGNDAYDAYLKSELKRALDILSSTGARVVVTTAPYNRRGERSDGTLYPEDQPGRVQEWNTMLREEAARRPNVSVLDFNAKLNPDGEYTAKINGVRMRSDGVHPTSEAVQWLTPWLLDSLKTPKP